MRGRYPSGPDYVQQLDGSQQAKARVQTVLETLSGTLRVQQACAQLGISEARFHELRTTALQAAVAALEHRPAGRPKAAAADPAVQALQAQLAGLHTELQASQIREEIALALPLRPPPAAEKKTRRRRPRRRPRKRN